jgi:hypothetical protein
VFKVDNVPILSQDVSLVSFCGCAVAKIMHNGEVRIYQLGLDNCTSLRTQRTGDMLINSSGFAVLSSSELNRLVLIDMSGHDAKICDISD